MAIFAPTLCQHMKQNKKADNNAIDRDDKTTANNKFPTSTGGRFVSVYLTTSNHELAK